VTPQGGRRGPGARHAKPPPRALLRTRSTSACMTPVTTDPIGSFSSLRGWPHDRLARTARGSRSEPTGHPALLPAGYLLAALLLLVLAAPALAGWVAGVVVVRFGWVSRGRLRRWNSAWVSSARSRAAQGRGAAACPSTRPHTAPVRAPHWPASAGRSVTGSGRWAGLTGLSGAARFARVAEVVGIADG
jgi:hypothetical protein